RWRAMKRQPHARLVDEDGELVLRAGQREPRRLAADEQRNERPRLGDAVELALADALVLAGAFARFLAGLEQHERPGALSADRSQKLEVVSLGDPELGSDALP